MPNDNQATVDDLKKQYSEMNARVSAMQKDFELKLESANRTADEWKKQAEKREEDLRSYQEKHEKEEKERLAAAAKAKESDILGFAESQIKAGKITPAVKDKIVAFMKSLNAESAVLEFTESDGSKRTHTQISLFREIIGNLKPIVPVGKEFTRSGNQSVESPSDSETDQETEQFMEVHAPGGKKTLPVAEADLAAKAFEYQEKNKVSYEDALVAVSKLQKTEAEKK